jgi:hypothetical protein
MWQPGFARFWRNVKEHRPLLVFTFGKALYDAFMTSAKQDGSPLRLTSDMNGNAESWWASSMIKMNGREVRLLHLPHPASRRWPGLKAYGPIIERQLRKHGGRPFPTAD